MIKNERQYRITKAAAARFEDSLQNLDSVETVAPVDVDPLVHRAEREALRSQLHELRSKLHAYEELASGRVGVIELSSLADLPSALVRARIASGMSHKDLADRLRLKEQQVQRYEATDYGQASLTRLLEVASALKLTIRKDLVLPNVRRSQEGAFSRFRDIGISKDFVLNRLVPNRIAAELAHQGEGALDLFLSAATDAVSHVFGWTPAAVLGEGRPWLDSGVLGAARFKVSENTEMKTFEVYTFYAHFLALLLLKATETLPRHEIPTDPNVIYNAVRDRYGHMSFRAVLNYCWDLGVPVLPLADPGAFHGACWRVGGRNIVVLKQRTHSLARWLFDLLHELRHAGEAPQLPTHTVVEVLEMSPERVNSEDEKEASWFAGEAALGGLAEELADRCVNKAGGSIERLKAVVPAVAAEGNVDVGLLANYMAFRLSLQGENWWGAAANLQSRDESPWAVARDTLLERADLSRLAGLDLDLFAQALQEAEA